MELVSTAGAIAASSDMGFMIKGLIPYKLFGQELWITTTHVSILIVDIVLLVLFIAAKKKMKNPDEVPKGFQNVIELIVEMLDNMIKGSLGDNAHKFANYIGSIFIFILISNISGVFGLRPPTADYGVTFPLGVLSFCIIQFNNVKHNKLGAAKALLDPIPLFFRYQNTGQE